MIEEKKGRKYDRAKWGWKDESEIIDHNCHYSGLPSPSSYEDKHHYYDSDHKQKTEEFSLKAILMCVIAMVFIVTLLIFLK